MVPCSYLHVSGLVVELALDSGVKYLVLSGLLRFECTDPFVDPLQRVVRNQHVLLSQPAKGRRKELHQVEVHAD